MRRAATFAAALVVGIMILTAGVAGAKTKTVQVKDDFFAPVSVKVKKNDKIKWSWDAMNGNSHNVTLVKGPKGVKKGCKTTGKDAYSPLISKCNKSASGAVGIKFTKKMNVKGNYKFICTIHPTVMTMTAKVGG